MKKTMYLSMCLLLTAWGCSDNEVLESVDDQPTPIEFSTYVRQATRSGNSLDLTALQGLQDGFGVFAYTTGDSPVNYISNGQVKYSNSSWTSTPTYYWPESAALKFYAYAPYASGTSDAKVTWAVNEDVASQTDFLVASNEGANGSTSGLTKPTSTSGGEVKFDFKHALSRIGVSVVGTTNLQFTVKVTDVTVKGKFYTGGTYDLTATSSPWSNLSPTTLVDKSYTLLSSGSTEVTSSTTTATNISDDYLMTIPGSISSFSVVVKYQILSNGVSIASNCEATYTPTDNASVTLEAGKAYTYQFKFDQLANASGATTPLVPIVWDVNSTVTAWSSETTTETSVTTVTQSSAS